MNKISVQSFRCSGKKERRDLWLINIGNDHRIKYPFILWQIFDTVTSWQQYYFLIIINSLLMLRKSFKSYQILRKTIENKTPLDWQTWSIVHLEDFSVSSRKISSSRSKTKIERHAEYIIRYCECSYMPAQSITS